MSVTYLGSKSIGQVCIGVAVAVPALSASLSELLARIANLQGQITANLALLASPPDPLALAAAIEAAAMAAVSQIASIIASIPAPLISANVSLGLDVAALLSLADLLRTLVADLSGALSAGGIHAWSVDSTAGAVGGELAAALSGGVPGAISGARVQGLLILTDSPAAFASLSKVLLV